MKRHESILLIVTVVLLITAWELSSDPSQPVGNWNEGEIPWNYLLWQFRHTLAPTFALVGFASAVGILFLRAAQWRAIPDPAAQHARQEAVQMPDQNSATTSPQG
jgi:hypothetical protein